MKLKTFSSIFIAFLIYYIVVHLYIGLFSVPTEGDSIAYHIPIAKGIVDGKIFNPNNIVANQYLRYSPGAAEIILSPLIALGIPLNIYNVLSIVVLFFVARFTGKRFGLKNEFSIIFAVTICGLNGIARWLNTQIIDIWVLVFFLSSLALLEKPKDSLKYFLTLGISIGMLCGAKFTGPIFAFILFIFYFKKIFKILTLTRFLIFGIPFLIFGVSWYLRNFMLTGNPIYPQPILSLPGGGNDFAVLTNQVWRVATTFPVGFMNTMNGYVAEYGIWSLAIFVVSAYLLIIKGIKNRVESSVVKLFGIGILALIVYLFLPSSMEVHIAVSVFRYSYPAFTVLILCIFLLAQRHKREEVVAFVSISNIFILGFPLFYYPKLVFIYIPIALGVVYFKSVKEYVINNKVRR